MSEKYIKIYDISRRRSFLVRTNCISNIYVDLMGCSESNGTIKVFNPHCSDNVLAWSTEKNAWVKTDVNDITVAWKNTLALLDAHVANRAGACPKLRTTTDPTECALNAADDCFDTAEIEHNDFYRTVRSTHKQASMQTIDLGSSVMTVPEWSVEGSGIVRTSNDGGWRWSSHS